MAKKKYDYFYHQDARKFKSYHIELWLNRGLISKKEEAEFSALAEKMKGTEDVFELGTPFEYKADPVQPKTEPAPATDLYFNSDLSTFERMEQDVIPRLEQLFDYSGELPYNEIDQYITSLSKVTLREKGELYLHLLKKLFKLDPAAIYSKEPFASLRKSVQEKLPIVAQVGDLCGFKTLKTRKMLTLDWAEDICRQAKAELAAKTPAARTAAETLFQKFISEAQAAPVLPPQPQPMALPAPALLPTVSPAIYTTPATCAPISQPQPPALVVAPAPQPTPPPAPVAPQPVPVVQQAVMPKVEAQNVSMISYIDLVFSDLDSGNDQERMTRVPRIVLRDAVIHVLTFLTMNGGMEDTIRRLFANRLHDLYALNATLEKEKLPSAGQGIDPNLMEEGEKVLKLIYQDGFRKDYKGLMKRMETLADQLPRFYINVYMMAVAAGVKIEAWDQEWAKYHWNEPAYFHLSIQALERTLHT